MADVVISISSREDANRWLSNVTLINEDYHDAMKEAGTKLQEMKDFCDGTMIDEFYEYGTQLLNAAEAVFNTISQIGELVNSVLDKLFGGFGEAAKGIIEGAANLIGLK